MRGSEECEQAQSASNCGAHGPTTRTQNEKQRTFRKVHLMTYACFPALGTDCTIGGHVFPTNGTSSMFSHTQ